MSVVSIIRDLLVADPTILAEVATYEGLPAVISPAPLVDVECPYIYITEIGSGDESVNRCKRGYRQLVEIAVIDDRTGSLAKAREIAAAVWMAIDRVTFADTDITGYLECSGGVRQLEDDQGFPGVVLSAIAHVWEA